MGGLFGVAPRAPRTGQIASTESIERCFLIEFWRGTTLLGGAGGPLLAASFYCYMHCFLHLSEFVYRCWTILWLLRVCSLGVCLFSCESQWAAGVEFTLWASMKCNSPKTAWSNCRIKNGLTRRYLSEPWRDRCLRSCSRWNSRWQEQLYQKSDPTEQFGDSYAGN
jgi:hypothetical protein